MRSLSVHFYSLSKLRAVPKVLAGSSALDEHTEDASPDVSWFIQFSKWYLST